MVTLETHQSQELQVPGLDSGLDSGLDPGPGLEQVLGQVFDQDSDSGPNAITVLTLLDKLVLMLDEVQRDQHSMEVHQLQMESVVRGIQADLTKLSKSHSHTANTVSKLLDKSKRLSVTMKEVRSHMDKQEAQVKKLELNHAHLIDRNQYRVLIFQDQTEIPSSVFVKDQPPFPRDEITEEGEEPEAEQAGLHTIDLSSDEDAGLEAELEDDWLQDPELLEAMEPTRAEKLKRSSLKKVDSLKKAFSKQNIEKKMTKIGTKLVSAEQKLKIKSPVSFGLKKSRGPEASVEQVLEAVAEAGDSVDAVAQEEVPSPGHEEQEVPPGLDQSLDQSVERDQDGDQDKGSAEGLSPDYALSSTLPQDPGPDQSPDQDTEEPQEKIPAQVEEDRDQVQDQDYERDNEQSGAKAEEE